jgi:hypothetical protein
MARTAGSLVLAATLCGLASLAVRPWARLASGYHDRLSDCWGTESQEARRIERDRPRDPYLELMLKRCAEKFDIWPYLLPF